MSCVYFIKSPALNAVKIGYSARNPHARLRAMQTGCADELVMLGWCDGTPEKEREFHEMLRANRIRGEWFRLEGLTQQFIDSFLRIYWSERRDFAEAEFA